VEARKDLRGIMTERQHVAKRLRTSRCAVGDRCPDFNPLDTSGATCPLEGGDQLFFLFPGRNKRRAVIRVRE
jgi:hypothetical protein